ncbi:MAG: RidA family protein [Pseudomonadota bacterium]|nr:RidA family protein [Pseudomonadota bacterium]
MKKEMVHTKNAPKAIGPYSQGIQARGIIYLSGQIALDPETMELVKGAPKEQVQQSLKNLSAVAEAAGASLVDAVKINVYLTDLSFFPLVNEVMEEFFAKPYPARVAIGVSELPRGALVEIDAILVP